MDNPTLTDDQRVEVQQFASAFLSKKDILKITQIHDCIEIDQIIEIEQLKQKAIVNNVIFKLAAANSSEAIKQALKIFDAQNQSKV
ncbi:hypothetical protein [Emticicia sp.]|uniref:hypothetical protein n=1 Tax=Emticicia sp. TaxID=1930953 RepID=UPI0037503694